METKQKDLIFPKGIDQEKRSLFIFQYPAGTVKVLEGEHIKAGTPQVLEEYIQDPMSWVVETHYILFDQQTVEKDELEIMKAELEEKVLAKRKQLRESRLNLSLLKGSNISIKKLPDLYLPLLKAHIAGSELTPKLQFIENNMRVILGVTLKDMKSLSHGKGQAAQSTRHLLKVIETAEAKNTNRFLKITNNVSREKEILHNSLEGWLESMMHRPRMDKNYTEYINIIEYPCNVKKHKIAVDKAAQQLKINQPEEQQAFKTKVEQLEKKEMALQKQHREPDKREKAFKTKQAQFDPGELHQNIQQQTTEKQKNQEVDLNNNSNNPSTPIEISEWDVQKGEWLRKGGYHIELSQWEEAFSYFEKVLQKEKMNVAALLGYGKVHEGRGDTADVTEEQVKDWKSAKEYYTKVEIFSDVGSDLDNNNSLSNRDTFLECGAVAKIRLKGIKEKIGQKKAQMDRGKSDSIRAEVYHGSPSRVLSQLFTSPLASETKTPPMLFSPQTTLEPSPSVRDTITQQPPIAPKDFQSEEPHEDPQAFKGLKF